MVTNLQMLAYFLNLLSIKHYLVQFWAKFWASTVNIKCYGILQTFRHSRNESKFQHNSSIFCLSIPLRSFYCNFNCSNMLLLSTVIQITQIKLSTNTHLWVIKWKPRIEIFPRRPPCIYTIWPTEVKSYNSCTAITHFLTPGTHTYQKSLWELFTQVGTDQPHWLMDYNTNWKPQVSRSIQIRCVCRIC